MCGFSPLIRCGIHSFESTNVPLTFTENIKSKRFISVYVVGVREIALALFITISIPPNSSTVLSTALLICSSCLISVTMGSALPPHASISSAAVKMVPGSLGCGSVVLAKIDIFAPSFANFLAIASPMPLLPPEIITRYPLSKSSDFILFNSI